MKEVIVNTFDERKDYLAFLEGLILSAFKLRKDFCRECGISESNLSRLLSGRKRLPNVERKILKYFNAEKTVIETIEVVRPAD